MLCMTNFARAAAGLGALADAEELDRSALGKADDVLRCDSFSHFACGREFTYWIRAAGYIGEALLARRREPRLGDRRVRLGARDLPRLDELPQPTARTSSATTTRSGSAC